MNEATGQNRKSSATYDTALRPDVDKWQVLQSKLRSSPMSKSKWSIGRAGDGLEKSGCCLTATTRDFAKIGRLYLHNGSWNGEQIVSSCWVEQSTAVDVTKRSAWNYQYQWWLASEDGDDFYASGHLGQYLYVNPLNR